MQTPVHKLLEKQIRKYFTPACLENESVQRFLDAVNNSYHSYDRDLALSDHAFRISEQEYIDVNLQLRNEINLKELGLTQLREAIGNLSDGAQLPEPRNDMGELLKQLNNQIDQRNSAEAALLANQEELKRLSMVASLNENGVIFTNSSGEIFWANDGFTQLTGYNKDEALGHTPVDLCGGPLTDKTILKQMIDAFLDGRTFAIEIIHYRKNGSWFWGYVKGQPVVDDKGEIVHYFAVIENITSKKKAADLLKKNEEKYRGIISNMNLGLLEVDRKGCIQFANQSFCELSGYRYEQLIGRKPEDLFIGAEAKSTIDKKEQLRIEGISDAYEIEAINKQGIKRWWLVSGAPRFNDKGEVVGSIGIHLDITDQKTMQLELQEARLAAEASSQSKEAFLANMSHEIRTPMNAILGMGRQLRKTSLSDKQMVFLDTINTAAENLLVIINDILDISKIEAGKLSIERIGFKMQELLQRSVRVLAMKAEEKGLQLSLDIDDTVPEIVLGDPYRLNQIVLNLVSNSIKFTEKGGISIRSFSKIGKNGQPELCIEVKDSGIGIDEEFLQHLFQKFQQEDASVARKYGGTGLGMSISKQLTELMGGSIQVSSTKNEGTTVLVQLPEMVGTEHDLPLRDPVVLEKEILVGKRVLLVEDNEMNRLVATTVLDNYELEVTAVENGLAAVNAVEEYAFDLVLMDVQMPVMDGFEATGLIRKNGHHDLPIIALTANAIHGEYDKCIRAGMNAYISKPFDEDELIQLLSSALGQLPSGRQAVSQEALETGTLYSLKRLQKLGSRSDFVQKMCMLFLDEAPKASRAIQEAYLQHDLKTIESVAHRIKPAFQNFEINCFVKEIAELEKLAGEGQNGTRLEKLVAQFKKVVDLVVPALSAEMATIG